MLRIKIETKEMLVGHEHRGVGMYAKLLARSLRENPHLELIYSTPGEKILADIIHYPYFDLFFSTLSSSHPALAVVTIHDVIPLLFPEQYPSGIKGKLNLLRQKKALGKVQAVITDSYASKEDIIKYLEVPGGKIHVVYLAGNPSLKKTDQKLIEKVSRKYSLPKTYLLYVGDINYNKNIPQLIKALKFLPPKVKLVCFGKNFFQQPIPEWQAIEQQLLLSEVGHRVVFLPLVLKGKKEEELAAIYSGAAAYVQPSLAEGFGLPVLEAMQCETPVVCAKNSSLVEIGGEHVVFSETFAQSIAEGVNEVLSWSANKRTKKTRKALKWSQKFSWEKAAEKTIKVYKSIL